MEYSATAGRARGSLPELESVAWRRIVDERLLRRDGRRWTAWTVAVTTPFVGAGVLLMALEPWTFPVALMSWAHAWVIPELYAHRGANAVRKVRTEGGESEVVALGLLGDLVGHEGREIAGRTGVALHRGRLGVWVVGEQGALLVRPGGRRVDCWCVRVAEADGLPGADRVVHLLLALREDEAGFATVANHAFAGAAWRVRRRTPKRVRPALEVARRMARG